MCSNDVVMCLCIYIIVCLFSCATVQSPLEVALIWWLDVLKSEIVEEYSWSAPDTPPAYLWVDARGVPPRCVFVYDSFAECLGMHMFEYVRCAAVLCVDGECHYTDGPPAQALVDSFTKRCDNQITTLEILAISVGLSTFCDQLAGRNVIVYSDNTGAEVSLSLYL